MKKLLLIFIFIFKVIHLSASNIDKIESFDLYLESKNKTDNKIKNTEEDIITIYGDFACPACGLSYDKIYQKKEKILKAVKDNKVKLIYKPTPMSEMSSRLWLFVNCEKNKFSNEEKLDILSLIYKNAASIYSKNYLEVFKLKIAKHNINTEHFDNCVQENLSKINIKIESAIKEGIKYTPSIFINKEKKDTNELIRFIDK